MTNNPTAVPSFGFRAAHTCFDTLAFMTYSRGGLTGHAAAIIGPLGAVEPVVGIGGTHMTQLGYAMVAYRDILRRLPADGRKVLVMVAEDLYPQLLRRPPLVTCGATDAPFRLDRKLSTELTTSLAVEIASVFADRSCVLVAPVKSHADDTGILAALFDAARVAVEDRLADAAFMSAHIAREKAAKELAYREDAKLTDDSVTWRDWDRMASRLEDMAAGRDPDTADGSPRRPLRGTGGQAPALA